MLIGCGRGFIQPSFTYLSPWFADGVNHSCPSREWDGMKTGANNLVDAFRYICFRLENLTVLQYNSIPNLFGSARAVGILQKCVSISPTMAIHLKAP